MGRLERRDDGGVGRCKNIIHHCDDDDAPQPYANNTGRCSIILSYDRVVLSEGFFHILLLPTTLRSLLVPLPADRPDLIDIPVARTSFAFRITTAPVYPHHGVYSLSLFCPPIALPTLLLSVSSTTVLQRLSLSIPFLRLPSSQTSMPQGLAVYIR
ncbi:hypothetical protein L226DRAFT_273615 [Lentinus tigrinus ALCF2SS1-7]|uniref:uncharacterized protein n=1 Tax=Lentinus tigrinus ALCF2SS1-7 TaxID=1328758 RepID=UPI001165D1AD|nr:hypothetical protein L226DRAFT_273615 [Lentinus tigrinus ALCF2SS1-7]